MPLVHLILSPYCLGSLPHLFPAFIWVRFGETKPLFWFGVYLFTWSHAWHYYLSLLFILYPYPYIFGFFPCSSNSNFPLLFPLFLLLTVWTPLLGFVSFPPHTVSQRSFMNHLALVHAMEAQVLSSPLHLMFTGSNCTVRRIQQGHITPAICHSYRWNHLCHWIPAHLLQDWNQENSSSFWWKQKFWEVRSRAQAEFSSPGKAPLHQW